MKVPFVAGLVAALGSFGCGGAMTPQIQSSPDSALGRQVGDIASDTKVLGEASAAVNVVVRNAPDCETAKAAIPEANRQLELAAQQVRTVAGKQSLEAMRKQVSGVVQLCP